MIPSGFDGVILVALALGWLIALALAVVLVNGWQARGTQVANRAELVPFQRRTEPETYRSLEWKGMIFRSKSEIKIAKTLDHRGIFFIPPTRVRLNAGKADRQSRELDFVICHEGKWGVLEVDGPFHVREADAERDGLLKAHGIASIQRFPSERCYQEPQAVVDEFLSRL